MSDLLNLAGVEEIVADGGQTYYRAYWFLSPLGICVRGDWMRTRESAVRTMLREMSEEPSAVDLILKHMLEAST